MLLAYALNFCLVAICIVGFMLPFYLWFAIRHKQPLHWRNTNQNLEAFFSSQQANWLVLTWAAAEAVVWFVIPEFLLLLVIFMRIHKKRQMLLYDVIGTVVGTAIAFAVRLPEHLIAQLPYIQDKMITQTREWYDDMGLLGLAHQPFSGVPYKVFTHLAWQYEFFFLFFLIVAVTVRMFRYVVAYGIFIMLYPKLHRIVNKNYLSLAAGAILIFSILLYNTYRIYQ